MFLHYLYFQTDGLMIWPDSSLKVPVISFKTIMEKLTDDTLLLFVLKQYHEQYIALTNYLIL